MRLLSYKFLIFPVLALVLPAMVILNNLAVFSQPDAFIFIFLENSKKGYVGYGIPGNAKQPYIDWSILQPGDIILGGYENCAYGNYSHAGMYLGDNKVVEAFVDYGITINDTKHYSFYQKLALLRVNAETERKQAALEYARSQVGGLFFPAAFKPGEDLWNCTKIIWLAYFKQGIDLDETSDLWIAPDVFLQSRYVTVLAER